MNYQVMRDLTDDEYRELKEDIAARGVMVPIEYDEFENVLDGHHRLKICEELGIKTFPRTIRAGMTDAQKRMHARKLNMARRHLSREDKQELIRDQLAETPEKSDRQIAAGIGVSNSTVSETRKKLVNTGELCDSHSSPGADGKARPREVNRKTSLELTLLENKNSLDAISDYIEKASLEDREKLYAMDSETQQAVIDRIISGKENSLHNAIMAVNTIRHTNKMVSLFNPKPNEVKAIQDNPKILDKMAVGGAKTVKDAAKQVSQAEKAERKAYTPPTELPETCRLFTGDIHEQLPDIEDNSIDFIITDPPYSQEYLPLYDELSQLASRVLKDGGSLLVMCGQSYLPQVMNKLRKYMDYHWTLAYLTPGGQSPSLVQKSANTFWKPVLWFVKGKYAGDYIGDVIKSPVNDNDKRFHEWGQSLGGFREIIEKFTYPGQVILDPFLGGGTTGVCAVTMGRSFIGTDVEQNNIEITKSRIVELIEEQSSEGRTD